MQSLHYPEAPTQLHYSLYDFVLRPLSLRSAPTRTLQLLVHTGDPFTGPFVRSPWHNNRIDFNTIKYSWPLIPSAALQGQKYLSQ